MTYDHSFSNGMYFTLSNDRPFTQPLGHFFLAGVRVVPSGGCARSVKSQYIQIF